MAARLSILIVVSVFLFLAWESWPAVREIGLGRFFSDGHWRPTPSAVSGEFSLLPMIVGTVAVTVGAVALAAPLGVLTAVWLVFYAPTALAVLYRRVLELLAAVPSVVHGLWGLVVLVPLIRTVAPPGASLLAGALVLTLMILPGVALMAEAVIRQAPREPIEAAVALGLRRPTIIRCVVLRGGARGLVTATLLQACRALGETMAVLMVCGNLAKFPGSVWDPVRTLTANIALEMGYATGDHRSALFVSGLFLLAVVTALVLSVERLRAGATDGR